MVSLGLVHAYTHVDIFLRACVLCACNAHSCICICSRACPHGRVCTCVFPDPWSHAYTAPYLRLRQRVTADPGKPGRNIHDIQDKPEGAVSSRSPTTTIRHGFLPAGRQTTTNGPPGKSKRLAYSKTRLSTIAAVRVRGESISRYLAKKRITHVETKENVPLICEP